MRPVQMRDPDKQVPLNNRMGTDLAQEGDTMQKDIRSCLFPPIMPPSAHMKDTQDPPMVALYQHQRKLEENQCLLAELARIERELRETLSREEERQEAQWHARQEENRQRWRSLCYLSLNQRTAKPWVSSYYKNVPMHIYCLPIQSARQRRIREKRGTK